MQLVLLVAASGVGDDLDGPVEGVGPECAVATPCDHELEQGNEVEAESLAYVVAGMLGLDANAYSTG